MEMPSFSSPALETIRVVSASHSKVVLSYSTLVRLIGSKHALVLVACTSATHMSFRAASSDQVQTGAFKYLQESIPILLQALGIDTIKVTVKGWDNSGKRANTSAIVE
ncbi:hypothetical protein PILCRDRAFT_16293 [Piloderma croceum F 1598]|uniref:Uncharacterized protein n=1 Tax=Piloderma croceum (strain F 1598) TaxID=765440 RepID=A0A0C3EI12_PILCF|nr:hypothetical protein PILCRDRAFT_16293 [Piloderma croceum F 1598]